MIYSYYGILCYIAICKLKRRIKKSQISRQIGMKFDHVKTKNATVLSRTEFDRSLKWSVT